MKEMGGGWGEVAGGVASMVLTLPPCHLVGVLAYTDQPLDSVAFLGLTRSQNGDFE